MKHYAADGATDVEGDTLSPLNVTGRYRMFKIGDDGLTEPDRRIAELEAAFDEINGASFRSDLHEHTVMVPIGAWNNAMRAMARS